MWQWLKRIVGEGEPPRATSAGSRRPSVPAAPSPRRPPLFDAIEAGDLAAVRRLLDQGADPAAVQDERSALLAAVKGGVPEVVGVLLDRGAPPNDGGGYMRPLPQAAEKGSPDIVRLLLDHGADPNMGHRGGITPLMEAAGRGDAALVELLIARGADPLAMRSDYGTTALGTAVSHKNTEAAIALLRHGARIDARVARQVRGDSSWTETPLAEAVRGGLVEVVAEMLDRAPSEHVAVDRAELPWLAVSSGSQEMCRLLFDRGMPFDGRDRFGNTPLVRAAAMNEADICAFLLEAGPVDAEVVGRALKSAVSNHAPGPLGLLLKAGADPNERTPDGYPVLAYAVSTIDSTSRAMWPNIEPRAVEVVKLLLSAGADPNGEGPGARTALTLAKEHRFQSLIGILEAAGAEGTVREAYVVLFYRTGEPTAVEMEAMLGHVSSQAGSVPRLLQTVRVAGPWPTGPDEFVVGACLLACQKAGVATSDMQVTFRGGPELAVAWCAPPA